MNTKLTLRLDERLIERAKTYSEATGKSLSQIVADYFAQLTDEGEASRSLPPLVRSLRGALKGADVEEDKYRRHLEEKYS